MKFLEVDIAALTSKLLSLGAKKVFDDDIKSISFNPRPQGIAVIRARKEGDKNTFTIKANQQLGKAKDTEEFEVVISEFDEFGHMMHLLGFTVRHRWLKHRVSYHLGDFSFEFDTFLGNHAGVPTFLEIEAHSEKGIEQAVELLGLDISKGVNDSQSEIVKRYSRSE